MGKRVLFVGGVGDYADPAHPDRTPHSFYKSKHDVSLNIDASRKPDVIGDINCTLFDNSLFDCVYFECVGIGDDGEPNINAILESFRLLKSKGHLCIMTGKFSIDSYKELICGTNLFHLISEDGKNKLRFIKAE